MRGVFVTVDEYDNLDRAVSMIAYIADRVAEFKLEGQFREILKRNDPDTI